jgi:hypothetical protein
MRRQCCAECSRDEDGPQTAPADPSHTAEPAPGCAAGNQELQRLARAGQAFGVPVGAADDPAERAADEAAALVADGEPVRRSPSGSGATVGGSGGGTGTAAGGASAAGAAPSAVAQALGAPGRALDTGTRVGLERGFGADFSAVRVHDGAAADQAAAAIGADAFTLGHDVVFATGRYAPGTPDGRRLLAHELTHVLQQRTGPGPVRRQTALGPAPPALTWPPFLGPTTLAGTGLPAPVRQSPAPAGQPAAPPTPETSLSTDVCLVNAEALTNEALVLQTNRVKTYLAARKRGKDDYYAYANLGRRLDDERRRRARLGHVYLTGDADQFPTAAYRLKQLGDQMYVFRFDAGQLRGMPGQLDGYVVTLSQFGKALSDLGIPQVDLGAYFATQPTTDPLRLLMPPRPAPPPVLLGGYGEPEEQDWGGPPLSSGLVPTALRGGRVYLSPFDMGAPTILSNPLNIDLTKPGSRIGALSNIRGALAELSYQRGSLSSMAAQRSLNDLKQNFEVYDYRSRFTGRLTSVTSTMPTPGPVTGPRPVGPIDTTPRFATYELKLAIALGAREQAKLGTATAELNLEYGTSLTPAEVAERGYLAVNSDHVELVRDRLRSSITQSPADYAEHIDTVLRAKSIELVRADGSKVWVGSWNELQAALPTLTPAGSQAAVGDAAELVARRVISNWRTTAEQVRLATFWEYTRGLGLSEKQYRARVPPELVASMAQGGTMPAAWQAGLRGGVVQGGIGTALDAYRMWTDPYERAPLAVPWELESRAALQFAGGWASSTAETAIVAAAHESLLAQSGLWASSLRGGARLVGGVGPAIVIAPAVTAGTMALDEAFTDAYYTRVDYAAAATRSAAAGVGGALAAGAYFALAGSAAGPVGTLVGLAVGTVGYLIVDRVFGQDIEDSTRLALGEGGCPRPAVLNLPDPSRGFCFAAGTRIWMADGSRRPIERVRRGDRVLALDVVTREPRAEVVERTVAHPAVPVLALRFADGTLLRTTSGHPLFNGTSWVAAGTLSVGDTVLACVERIPAAVTPSGAPAPAVPAVELRDHRVLAVMVEPEEQVYDLSVSGTHTFVAENVVAHNKYL